MNKSVLKNRSIELLNLCANGCTVRVVKKKVFSDLFFSKSLKGVMDAEFMQLVIMMIFAFSGFR